MKKTGVRNIQLGLFVILGILCLTYALYMIGSKKNLFGSTFRVNALFHNVNGLEAGNNVRFLGIDIGTIESIKLINDSSVGVVMVIEKNAQKFINRNSLVDIGTDGVMGNKLVTITAGNTNSFATIKNNDTLNAIRSVGTDEMLQTFNKTNDNLAIITSNLKILTSKLNMDTTLLPNLNKTMENLRISSQGVSEVVDAAKQNFLLRGYFKKQEKKEEKKKEETLKKNNK